MTVWDASLDERFAAGIDDGASRPAVLVDIGERDRLRSHTDTLVATFDRLGIDASFEVHPGGHDFPFVADRLADWMTWLIDRVTPEP